MLNKEVSLQSKWLGFMRGCVSLEEVVFPGGVILQCKFLGRKSRIYIWGLRSATTPGDATASLVVVEHCVDHSSIRMWPTLFLVGWPSPEELARLSLSGVSVIRLTGNSDRGRASKHAVFAIITIIIIITRPYHRIHTFPSRKRNPMIKNASYFFGINCLGAGVM